MVPGKMTREEDGVQEQQTTATAISSKSASLFDTTILPKNGDNANTEPHAPPKEREQRRCGVVLEELVPFE